MARAPHIVFVHGIASDQHIFDRVRASMPADLSTCAIDLPGFGRAPMPRTPWRLSHGVAAVGDHITRAHEGAPVTLVGHSLGAAACLLAAVERPELVENLIALAIAGFGAQPYDPPSQRDRIAHAAFRNAARFAGPLVLRHGASRAHLFRNVVADPRRVSTADAVLMSRGVSRGRASMWARSDILAADLRDAAQRLTTPTVIVHGMRDTAVDPRVVDWFERNVPVLERAIRIPDAGHALPMEAPETIAAIVEQTVRRHA